MFKSLPLRDWLAFSEKFGTPGIVGKTDAAIDSPEWNAMIEAVQAFSQDWATVMNQTGVIELIEAKGNGEQPFKPLVDLMDEEMTRLWRGADLGTTSKRDSNGASLQADETDILETDDAELISETLQSKVSRYALAWKFGWDAPQLAYIQIKAPEKDTVTQDLAVDTFLLAAGAPLSVADTLARYDRSQPDAGEELLTRPAAPVADPEQQVKSEMANALTSPKLLNQSRALMAAAVQDDLSHALERLRDILGIADDELFLKKLQAFAADFPQFKTAILADPAAARALQPILSAALANGLATKS
jgi:phage gp29-like protein